VEASTTRDFEISVRIVGKRLALDWSSIKDCRYLEHTGNAALSAHIRREVVDSNLSKKFLRVGSGDSLMFHDCGQVFNNDDIVVALTILHGTERESKPTFQASNKAVTMD